MTITASSDRLLERNCKRPSALEGRGGNSEDEGMPHVCIPLIFLSSACSTFLSPLPSYISPFF